MARTNTSFITAGAKSAPRTSTRVSGFGITGPKLINPRIINPTTARGASLQRINSGAFISPQLAAGTARATTDGLVRIADSLTYQMEKTDALYSKNAGDRTSGALNAQLEDFMLKNSIMGILIPLLLLLD